MTKFLNISTDNTLGGNSPSDDVVSSQKAVQEYVDSHSSSVSLDNSTISTNSSNQLQTIGLINKNTASGSTNPIYDWIGTLAEYNAQAVATNHPEWVCFITDDVSGGTSVYTKAETDTAIATAISAMLGNIYPVGSTYIGTTSTCPMASLISNSTWTLKSSGIVTSVNTSVPIKGDGITLGLTDGTTNYGLQADYSSAMGYFTQTSSSSYGKNVGTARSSTNGSTKTLGISTDSSKSGIVGTVTRSTLSVNIWQRTA